MNRGARSRSRLAGFSLTELLCVIGIIAFLAALYLGEISKAFRNVLNFLSGD